MVHTTALLVKTWIEYERWKTKERSVLQLQVLVDQHMNRLSVGQMATTDVNAPADERMRFIYSLVMPPLWTMKAQLADRWMGLHVKRSALKIYEELEMWEDVVQCLLDLQEDKRARELIMSRDQQSRANSDAVLLSR